MPTTPEQSLPFDRILHAQNWLDENGYVQTDLRGLEFMHKVNPIVAKVQRGQDGDELQTAKVTLWKAHE